MLLSIPPKCSVSQVVGFLKGKSALSIARSYIGRRKNFTGQSFWARGYYVSTVAIIVKLLCASIFAIRKQKTSVWSN